MIARTRSSFVVLLVLVSAAAASAQDLLQLKDGRFVQAPGVTMTRTPRGRESPVQERRGPVPVDLILEAAVSKTDAGAEEKPPPDAAEKEAQGFVRFENKWMKADQRDKLLEDRRKARANRIKQAMEHRDWAHRYKSSTQNFEFEDTINPEVDEGLLRVDGGILQALHGRVEDHEAAEHGEAQSLLLPRPGVYYRSAARLAAPSATSTS